MKNRRPDAVQNHPQALCVGAWVECQLDKLTVMGMGIILRFRNKVKLPRLDEEINMPRTKRQQFADIPVRAPNFGNIPPLKIIGYLIRGLGKMNLHTVLAL